MAERTPGPWHIKAGSDLVIESQYGTSIAAVYTPGGIPKVRQANGRFIAAAPDMEKALEAVKRDVAVLRLLLPSIDQVYAALAKAKGEANA